MELNELYREVILDHNRHPRNFGRLDPADALANGHNPLCGDKLTVTLNLQGDVISDLKFDGNGCDRSSVSAMFDKVHALLTQADAPSTDLGKLAALSGVREFPARVKCASLCWHTLNAALANADAADAAAVSTE